MAKTIKFNLVCDGYQVRTLDDLRNHFSIEDILQYYRDKVLEKWLTVRGYTEELEAVKSIQLDSPLETIERLVSIFDVETDKQKIEYATSIIRYREDRIECEKLQRNNDSEVRAFYNRYFEKYEKLKTDIMRNPLNKPIIQAAINEIVNRYADIFDMDYRNFFYEIRMKSSLAIICLLMNPSTRKYYVVDDEKDTQKGRDSVKGLNRPIDFTSYEDKCNEDKTEMYEWIKNAVNEQTFLEGLGNNVITKQQDTETRFVELTKKKCIVIKLERKNPRAICAISRASDNEHFLKPEEVNGKFLIMEGLQYQSTDEENKLYYIKI